MWQDGYFLSPLWQFILNQEKRQKCLAAVEQS